MATSRISLTSCVRSEPDTAWACTIHSATQASQPGQRTPGAARELDGAAKLGFLQPLNLVVDHGLSDHSPSAWPACLHSKTQLCLRGSCRAWGWVSWRPHPCPDREYAVAPCCTSLASPPSSAIALGPSDGLVCRGRMLDLAQASRLPSHPLGPSMWSKI